MALVYIVKLGFNTLSIMFIAQKIDGSILAMFEIFLVSFKVKNKFDKA